MQAHSRLAIVLSAFVIALGGCGGAFKQEAATLRVMSYNIKHGRGNDGVVDLERAAAVIEAAAPDVVTIQEVDESCNRSGNVDEAVWLGERLGMTPIFGAFMNYDGGRYGMALLSRLPIIEWENHILPPGAEPRSALAARLRLADGAPGLPSGAGLPRRPPWPFRRRGSVGSAGRTDTAPTSGGGIARC